MLFRSDWAGFEARKAASAKNGRLRGRGLASYLEWTGALPTETVDIEVAAEGTVTVYSGTMAMGQGLQVKIGIIGRDRNILEYQQTRVRGEPTFVVAVDEFQKLSTWDPVFLSYELLHLYGRDYLRQISAQLKFPIDYNNPELNNITEDDTNSKYFKPINYHPTDDLARHASRKWK